jgi:hypothetical protein
MGSSDLLSNWRVADHAAMAATQFTVAKSILALDGMGEPPSPGETEAVKMLRRIADARFTLAMGRMSQLVHASVRSGTRMTGSATSAP